MFSLHAPLALTFAALGAGFVMAQPGPGGNRGGFDGPRPPLPIVEALDADGNGNLSPDEIDNATQALLTLDKNSDGRLTRDEFLPRMGGRWGGRAGVDRPGRLEPAAQNAAGGRDPEKIVKRLMQFDENDDGELSESELPERLRNMLSRADKDDSKSLSESEVRAIAERSAARGGPAGRGERSGKGGKQPNPNRPKRPLGDNQGPPEVQP